MFGDYDRELAEWKRDKGVSISWFDFSWQSSTSHSAIELSIARHQSSDFWIRNTCKKQAVKVTESLIFPFLPQLQPSARLWTFSCLLVQLHFTYASPGRRQRAVVSAAEDALFSQCMFSMSLGAVKADPPPHAYFRSQCLINPRLYLMCLSSNKNL